jgi:hypothetical protein
MLSVIMLNVVMLHVMEPLSTVESGCTTLVQRGICPSNATLKNNVCSRSHKTFFE